MEGRRQGVTVFSRALDSVLPSQQTFKITRFRRGSWASGRPSLLEWHLVWRLQKSYVEESVNVCSHWCCKESTLYFKPQNNSTRFIMIQSVCLKQRQLLTIISMMWTNLEGLTYFTSSKSKTMIINPLFTRWYIINSWITYKVEN